ncbi:hypothetical protein P168DRAFT_292190 [Aspergillus campestris IBT 28561]|uniref:Uncharacterized protein n=1 Tax=Aspergillus campestris (strain IBT 28561) TaxID=1392248 RepID=A0A2I1CWT4_ASPC2|nr:uncharacterized protein P168DRAFT_292190 [Aspergillus campestris IBT 28561]PKY02082.1 hypothetical protein P168DRAFT_292190 [Aspergillus campestris IBT 28561]
MSSLPANSSPRSTQPPQSAQPYQSLFGGPSSQDIPDSLNYYGSAIQTQQGHTASDQDALDAIMEEVPLIDNDLSDDATYTASDDDDDGGLGTDDDTDTEQMLDDMSNPHATTAAPARPERALSSSPEYRPNRFRGPDSTWRNITAEDRQNAQALEEMRARDLSAHLYNAFALRLRARDIARQAARSKTLLSESDAFVPPRRWAAWPAPSSEVPRVNERFRIEEDAAWTLRMQPDVRPSADLEESVMAVMLKTAKERFEARPWRSRGRSLVRKRGGMALSQAETQDESMGVMEEESDPELIDGVPLRPAVQADDDLSRQQLCPITRNVLTQLDRLLMGLHHARQSGLAADDSASEPPTDAESIASGTSSPKKRTAISAERSQSRGRKRTRRASRGGASTGTRSRSVHTSHAHSARASKSRDSTRSRGRSPGSDRGRSRSRVRLGVRDWSEVLGVASMLGLPSAAVMRTSQRCAALFGEDMSFQTFKEGKLQEVQQEGEESSRWGYIGSESEEETRPSPPASPPPLSSRPHSRAISTKGQSHSRANSSAAPDTDDDGSKPKGKGRHRKQDLICPIRTCKRSTDGFSRRWNLNLHVQRMHPGVSLTPRGSGANSPVELSKEEIEIA